VGVKPLPLDFALIAAIAALGAWCCFGRIGAGVVLLLAAGLMVLVRLPFPRVGP